MITFAQWGGIWGLFTLMTQAPTYLKHIHGWDIRSVIVTILFFDIEEKFYDFVQKMQIDFYIIKINVFFLNYKIII